MSKHLYKLGQSKPKKFMGGELRGASAHEFPILKGQKGAMYSVALEPGGVREPHWHPNAWEFDYCIAGLGRMTVLAPQGEAETFDVHPGDVVFVPQGHLHYFENIGPEPLHFVVAFNNEEGEAEDDVGIAAAVSVLPHNILAKLFNVSEATFSGFRSVKDRLVMV
ncbi:MAG TPA: cupin domain-containing protein, partial [Puia sp.]|nr:cupin domain-containing protein [Puia sp.]